MKRYFEEFLIDRKSLKTQKPLIISGARQVEKTFFVDYFGKKYSKNYIKININAFIY